MRHPPTPPDDKNHNPGYITPPNAADLLTPQLTPRGMRKPSDAQQNARHGSPRGATPAANEQEAMMVDAMSDLEMHKAASVQTAGLATDDAYIPHAETDLTAVNMQGDDSPRTSSSQQGENASPLRIRKKRKPRPSRQHVQVGAVETENWNDLPDDMIANDNLYNSLRRRKMDRLEAIEDGSAIEAVVLTTGDERKPSLRHVKKRHSLRMASAGSAVSSNASAGAEDPSAQDHKTSLRHKKAFAPARQEKAFVAPVESISNPSASPARVLRHERRPLSAGGRPQTSSSQTMALPLTATKNIQTRHVSAPITTRNAGSHSLRRVSKEQRLETKNDALIDADQHGAHELPLYNSLSLPGLSPTMKSHRFANTMTPMSGMSDRTEMELCEAKNVTLFAHSNDSVLLINNGNITAKKADNLPQLAPRPFGPLSLTFENPEPSSCTSSDSLTRSLSTPEIQLNGNIHTVDSPLTNPRAAPLPPAIQINPPTPSVEADKQLVLEEPARTQAGVQRRGSLMQTARRLSGTLLTPFALQRRATYKEASRPSTAPGNDRLHPMWQPTSMWDDEDEYSDEDDYEYEHRQDGRLPAGGDTSDHPQQQTRNSIFPRKMSVRMPGFRGSGGFLQGNSLGVERHGTNKRRPHVELPGRTVQSKNTSFLSALRRRVRSRRAAREEAAAEKRRAELKESIGMRVVHHV